MKLSEREKAVGKRLRAFREVLGISRTKFSLAVGIGSERMASYESGRAPVRYEVFSAITKRFFLNPWWLAGGDSHFQLGEPFDDGKYRDKINPRLPFLEVFDLFLKHDLAQDVYLAEQQGANLCRAAKNFFDYLKSHPKALSDPRVVEIRETVREIGKVFLDVGKNDPKMKSVLQKKRHRINRGD